MTKISRELLERLLAQERWNIRAVARIVGLSYTSLWKRCKRYGIKKPDVTQEDLKTSYELGMTVAQVAKKHRVRTGNVIEMLGKGVVSSGPRIHMNQDFFEKIDSEEKAYWLGVLASDGSVHGGDQAMISFAAKSDDDAEWVIAFRDAVKSSVACVYVKNEWNGAVHVKLTSDKMRADLEKLGIIPNKTYSQERWVVPGGELERHYWRGVCDGDGCVSEKYVNAVTSASPSMILACREWLTRGGFHFFEVDAGTKSGLAKTIRLTGENASRYADVLYSGSSIYLRRKMRNAMTMVGKAFVIREGVMPISNERARLFIKKHHYLADLKSSKTYGLFKDDELEGVVAISSCSSPAVAPSVCPEDPGSVREIHRLCLANNEKNDASMLLGRAIRLFKRESPDVKILVAYADVAQGHEGTVYKAIGAEEVEASMSAQLVVVTPDGKRFTGRQEVILTGVKNAGFELSQCSVEESGGKRKFLIRLYRGSDVGSS